MAIWQGTFFAQLFILKDCKTGLPVDITGWEFHAQMRLDPDEPLLLDLSSADGEFVVHNGPSGTFSMQIRPEDTASLPEDETLVFDILRTAPAPGPILLLYGKVPVRQPVTQALVPLPPPVVPTSAVTMRQWQSALQAQGKLQSVLDVLPADQTSSVYIQWTVGGIVLPPPYTDAVWTFTQSVTGYSNDQMTTLYKLALTMAV